jgi:hypothetical protein
MAFSLGKLGSGGAQYGPNQGLKNFEFVKYHTDAKFALGDKIVIGILLTLLALQLVNGFLAQRNEIIDESKSSQIASIIQSLSLFYKDSSRFLESRYYPVAKCSNDLNEFDYEYTLRGEITGLKSGSRTHTYITKPNFPTDPQGNYANTFASNYACKTALPAEEQKQNNYYDNYKHCSYDINNTRDCYLYTSSLNGDSFKLAYWSPYYNKFVVYSQFREEPMSVKLY